MKSFEIVFLIFFYGYGFKSGLKVFLKKNYSNFHSITIFFLSFIRIKMIITVYLKIFYYDRHGSASRRFLNFSIDKIFAFFDIIVFNIKLQKKKKI